MTAQASERELLALADELVAIAEERRSVAMRCYADGGNEDDTPLEEYTEYQAAIALRLAASRAGGAPAWQPIETAPRDGTRVLLFWPGQHHNRICCGNFDLDQYNKKPEPYWSHDQERSHGKINAKKNPPTHWMSPPAPPISRPQRGEESSAPENGSAA